MVGPTTYPIVVTGTLNEPTNNIRASHGIEFKWHISSEVEPLWRNAVSARIVDVQGYFRGEVAQVTSMRTKKTLVCKNTL